MRRLGGLAALALLAAGVGVGQALTPSDEHAATPRSSPFNLLIRPM